MAAEARRHLLRISTNYARLGAALVIGIILTRLQVVWLGSEGFGLIALLVSTTGLGTMFSDLSRQSLVRELAAWRLTDEDRFLRAYNSSYVLSLAAAGITLALFGIIVVVVPLLRIDAGLVTAARVFLLSRGIAQAAVILLRPVMTMYIVRERFVAFNLFSIMQRSNPLLAVLALMYFFRVKDPARAVLWFGVAPAILNLALVLVFTGAAVLGDRRLVPRPSLIGRDALREIGATFGWNSGVILAINMHERVAAIIMNVAFGLWANTVFGLALRLTSYVRMATVGMTFGVDAATARLSTTGAHERVLRLLHHSTRLHTLMAAPAAIAVWALAPALLHLWVGAHLEDAATILPRATVLVRIMLLGLAARAVSDGWLRILYGAGHVRTYAPVVLLGGLANPVLVLALFLILPESFEYTAVGWAYSAIFLVIHCGVAPVLGARKLGVPVRDFWTPVLRPLGAALAAAPVIWLVGSGSADHAPSLAHVAVAGALYSVVYGFLVAMFVVTPDERRRITRGVLRRFKAIA